MPRAAIQLDRLDLRLLACLQGDSRLTHAELGSKIGLSSTAVLRRIRRLRDHGVIALEAAVLEPEKLGFDVTAIVQVTLTNETATNRAFGERLSASANVSQCYYVSGSADFVVIASFRTMAEYHAFAERFLARGNHVRRFVTQFMLRSDKRTLALPITPR